MEHKNETSKDTNNTTSTESRGVLGSVWSAAGALAETVSHAVQGTVDRIHHDAEDVTTVSGYIASKVIDTASSMYGKTMQVAEHMLPASIAPSVSEPPTSKPESDSYDSYFASPTNDYMDAMRDEPTIKETPSLTGEITSEIASRTSDIIDSAKKAVGDMVSSETLDSAKHAISDVVSGVTSKASEVLDSAKQSVSDNLKGDSLLDMANQVAQLNIKHASEAVKDTVNTLTGDVKEGEFQLVLSMDVVAHLQRIADRTGDKLLHETARKAHSACAKGESDAPGVHLVRVTPDQATELVNLAIMTQDHELADFARYCQSVAATTQIGIEPYPGKIQEGLARGRNVLIEQGRVHTGPGYGAAFASVSRVAPTTTNTATSAPIVEAAPASVSGSQLTMDMVAHLQRIADRTGDKVLHDTARKAHSACAKGASEAPGVHLVSISPDQASELVNLAIRTQDHELANFARYCQSVAATTQLGIEPAPGKIAEEIEKGRQELLQQGRTHTGPGYGAAFASISRSNSSQSLNLSRSNSSQSLNLSRSTSLQNLLAKTSRSSSPTNVLLVQESAPTDLQLTMDVVAHLQRIADRTGDALLHETARKAHSACAKNLNEAPGVHLTVITPDQATELVNLAIRTQDTELADFARYCQSVAATTQIGVEPSPGKILEEIEKGRQELLTQGPAHTGPGYGAAFASKQMKAEPMTKVEQQDLPSIPASLVGQPSQ